MELRIKLPEGSADQGLGVGRLQRKHGPLAQQLAEGGGPLVRAWRLAKFGERCVGKFGAQIFLEPGAQGVLFQGRLATCRAE